MRKIHFTLAWGLCALFSAATETLQANDDSLQPPLKATYNTPAKIWESEALPIGNGYMGAMIFGGVYEDVIQTNEHTVWSGGPGENAAYNGGHLRTPEENHDFLQRTRKELQRKMNEFTANKSAYIDGNGKLITKNYDGDGKGTEFRKLIDNLAGDKDHFGSFQTLSNIVITTNDSKAPMIIKEAIETNYENKKNPDQGISKLFDGNGTSKWFADNEKFTGNRKFPCIIKWAYTNAPKLTSYELTSANDMPGRDPKSWKLYGSTDGKSYTLIDEQSGIFWPEKDTKGKENRHKVKSFPLKADRYRFFKMEINELVDNRQKPQLGEITMGYGDSYSDYNRTLDIDNSIHTISYKEDGTTYKREYFMSYPDNVMVVRLTSDKKNGISRTISLESIHKTKTITAEGKTITMTGYPTPVSGNKRVGDA